MNDNSIGIHRTVSSHVLNYIPVTPRRPETSKWPLGFMTDRCRRADKNEDIHEPDFGPEELLVSGKILQWQKRLDTTVKENIAKDVWIEEKINGTDKYFFPPIVIRAKAGFGKSVLIGKLMAELIDAKYSANSNGWPIYERLVYSQLKDQTGENLEYAICNGMDGHHKCNNLESFFDRTQAIPAGDKLILIDSLDENPGRDDWWKISQRLSEQGWRVLWTCRDPDWDAYNLSKQVKPADGEPTYYRSKNETMHWDIFAKKSWKLELDTSRKSHLDEVIEKVSQERAVANLDIVHQFIHDCYRDTQLMHIYHTNFDMEEFFRDILDKQLIENLLERRDKLIENNSGISDLKIFDEREWYDQFFEINLAKVIIDTSLLFYKEDDEIDYNVPEQWAKICKEYYESQEERKPGQLDESIVSESPEISDLMKFLKLSGILRETSDGMKFRHRDFAVIAYVEGSPGNLSGLFNLENHFDDGVIVNLKDDILFKHFFPTEVIGVGDQTEIVEEFLRRTGNITSQLNVISNIPLLPRDLNYIAKSSLDKVRIVETESNEDELGGGHDKGLSEAQITSLSVGTKKRAIVLHGVPGSGKTFSGVERILIRQATTYKEGKSDSFALIVSLTDELADSISQELERHHLNSPFLQDLFEDERPKVIKSIQVKSLKTLLEEWLPELENLNDNWLIDDDYLKILFNRLKNQMSGLQDRTFRKLQADYQQNMFDETTGNFSSLEEYLSKNTPPGADDLTADVRQRWYTLVDAARNIGMVPVNEACALIRNRLLKFEHQTKPSGPWPENYAVASPQLSFNETKSFDLFDKKNREGLYDCIMVDEVQDLPAIAINMLSFMSPDREPNRFILSGDKYQTLNGQKFEWEKFLRRLSYMTTKITSDHSHIDTDKDGNLPVFHHLSGLYWDNFDIDAVIQNKLKENHRNDRSINALTVHSWRNWPSQNYFENSEPMEMVSKRKRRRSFIQTDEDGEKELEEFTPIMVIGSKDSTDYVEKIELILGTISKRSGVSLLCTNEKLREFVKLKMDEKSGDGSLKVETFDPWTIKGLERNGVVILGAYTSSQADIDSEVLWGVNFDRNKKFEDFTAEQIEAINLMRRKMLVSNTRAVEQLIILESPQNGVFNIGNTHDYRMKSLNPPDYQNVVTEPEIVVVEEYSELEETLKDFFLGSVIKPQHISIKRISEGLKLQTRAGTESGKEEYARYEASLRNILANDHEKSILRKLLHETFANRLNIDLNKHSAISDIMMLNNKERSYIDSKKSQDPDIKNIYSLMVRNSILVERQGPWSDTGFSKLYGIFTRFNRLGENLTKAKRGLNTDANISIKDLIDDIDRVVNSIFDLFSDFASKLGLPVQKSDSNSKREFTTVEDEGDLVMFLFSENNNIKNSKYTSIKDSKFALFVLDKIKSKINIDNKGLYSTTLSNKKTILVKWDFFKKFLDDMLLLDFKPEGNLSATTRFAKEMLHTHTVFLSNVESKNTKLETQTKEKINTGYSFSIRFLVKHGTQEDLDDNSNEIVQFISNQFPGMNPSQISAFLDEIIDRNMVLMNRVEDENVLEWNLHNFITFTNKLQSQIHSASRLRANRLYNNSKFVWKVIRDAISFERNFVEFGGEAENLMSKDDLKPSYSDLLNHMKRHVLKTFRENEETQSGIPEVATRFWKELVTLTEIFNLGDIEFSESEKLDQLISDHTTAEFLESQGEQIFSELVDTLELVSSNYNFLFGNYGKKLVISLIQLKGIMRNHNAKKFASLPIVEQFPVLQLTNIFKLERAIDHPHHFSLGFDSDTDEREWVDLNKLRYVYSGQLDADKHLNLMASMFENWEANMMLYRLLAPENPTPNSQRVGWKFDGFGNLVDFDSWVKANNQFFDFLNGKTQNVVESDISMLQDFHLDARLKMYLNIIEVALEYLNKTKSATVGSKTLMNNILPLLYKDKLHLYRRISIITPSISVTPLGEPLKYKFDKETGKGEIRPASWEPSEFYSLLKNLMKISKKHKINKEEAIEDLIHYKDLLEGYLNRDQIEYEQILEQNVNQGNWKMDVESVKNFGKLLSGKDQTKEVSGPQLEENPESADVSVTDDEVMNSFNIPLHWWKSMEEKTRQMIRDDYKKKQERKGDD